MREVWVFVKTPHNCMLPTRLYTVLIPSYSTENLLETSLGCADLLSKMTSLCIHGIVDCGLCIQGLHAMKAKCCHQGRSSCWQYDFFMFDVRFFHKEGPVHHLAQLTSNSECDRNPLSPLHSSLYIFLITFS